MPFLVCSEVVLSTSQVPGVVPPGLELHPGGRVHPDSARHQQRLCHLGYVHLHRQRVPQQRRQVLREYFKSFSSLSFETFINHTAG